MKFDPLIKATQSCQYDDWRIVHSPALSSNWLVDLLKLDLPVAKDSSDTVIKLEENSLILKLDSDLGTLIAKHYRKSTIKRLIRNTFEQTRAYRSWTYAHFMKEHGIETPEPLAYIEEKRMGVIRKAWYVSRFDESVTCDNYFLHTESITPAMANMVMAIVDMFFRLRECQLSHGDFKASNLLLSEKAPSLIDLDSMKFHTNDKTAERMWRRDIKRFMDNWHERFDIYNKFKQAFEKRGIEL